MELRASTVINYTYIMKWIFNELSRASILLLLLISCQKAHSTIKKQSELRPHIFTNKGALDRDTPHPNLQAPDFTLKDKDGNIFKLSSQIGKVVVLNYWSTNCGPCIAEIPGFIKLQNEMADKGVRFVGISYPEKWKTIIPFARKHKINYTLLVDDSTFFAKYGPMPGPTTFVINRRGEIAHIIAGEITQKELKPLLVSLAE